MLALSVPICMCCTSMWWECEEHVHAFLMCTSHLKGHGVFSHRLNLFGFEIIVAMFWPHSIMYTGKVFQLKHATIQMCCLAHHRSCVLSQRLGSCMDGHSSYFVLYFWLVNPHHPPPPSLFLPFSLSLPFFLSRESCEVRIWIDAPECRGEIKSVLSFLK